MTDFTITEDFPRSEKDREKLSGRVEVDEFFIGGPRSGKRGRGAEGKTIVAVAVER